jgi:ATP-binding cassette, subfamily F, member 3
LDLRAKDVLLEAVHNFTGTVIFVSHDRYFIDGLSTRVFEVEGGHVHVYPGNYADYLYRKQNGQTVSGAVPSAAAAVVSNQPVSKEKTDNPEEPAAEKEKVRRLNPIKLRQMQDRCTFVEEEIPRVEAAIALTEQELGNFVSAEETQRLVNQLEELRKQQTSLTAEWEELMLQLEEQSAV